MEKSISKLEDRLIRFSVDVVLYSEGLPATSFGIRIKDQIARSSPSVALNYGEAQSAESRRDFVHKMKVCLKELRETYNALRIIDGYHKEKNGNAVPAKLLDEANQLISIFVRSVQTAENGRRTVE